MSEIFITCPENIEALLVQELKQLKVKGVRAGYRGAFAPQTLETVYTVNYRSRLATRVLWPLSHFRCHDKTSLYEAAKQISWLPLLNETQTFAIDANVSHHQIRNSLFGAQVMKDGICDHIRDIKGARPSVDVKNPDVQLNLFIHKDRGIISLDTSGTPLYKRGWRTLSSDASIQENLAAALLIHAGYNSQSILCDPFCGSGTFLIEAALIATRTPPGYFRTQWGFLKMPEHDPVQWDQMRQAANAEKIPLAPGRIFGADKDRHTLASCATHLANIGLNKEIMIQNSPISRYLPPSTPTLIVCNPPYGKRLDTSFGLYRELGEFLKSNLRNQAQALVLAPNKELIKATNLPFESSLPFHHGGLPITAYSLS